MVELFPPVILLKAASQCHCFNITVNHIVNCPSSTALISLPSINANHIAHCKLSQFPVSISTSQFTLNHVYVSVYSQFQYHSGPAARMVRVKVKQLVMLYVILMPDGALCLFCVCVCHGNTTSLFACIYRVCIASGSCNSWLSFFVHGPKFVSWRALSRLRGKLSAQARPLTRIRMGAAASL